MRLIELAQKITEKKVLKFSEWPEHVYFDSETQNRLNKIKSFSMKPRNYLFVSESGNSAYEYAFTVIYVIDTLYYSKTISGNYNSVKPLPRISITPLQNGSNVSFEITIGDTSFSSKLYNVSDFKDSINWSTIMSAHTHPRIYLDKTHYYHTWFSVQDFSFLLGGPVPIVALLTDNFLWLACKTDQSIFPDDSLIQKMTLLDRDKKFEEMKNLAKEISASSKILFFRGGISSKLVRI